jgi:hypothetical protein
MKCKELLALAAQDSAEELKKFGQKLTKLSS